MITAERTPDVLTDTTSGGRAKAPEVPRERYQPAGVGRSSDIIFFGPKMQAEHTIRVGNRSYVAQSLFMIRLEYDPDGTVFASHRTLPVHAYGATTQQALDAFGEAFDMQWRHLVEADEEELTEDAKVLRERLRAAVTMHDG